MTRTSRGLSLLVLALEESGFPVLETDVKRLYVRCPFTRWHADVRTKHAEIVLGFDGVSPDELRCEICGGRSASEVLGILSFAAVRRASLRHSQEVARLLGIGRRSGKERSS
jgi:hypothetical protein